MKGNGGYMPGESGESGMFLPHERRLDFEPDKLQAPLYRYRILYADQTVSEATLNFPPVPMRRMEGNGLCRLPHKPSG